MSGTLSKSNMPEAELQALITGLREKDQLLQGHTKKVFSVSMSSDFIFSGSKDHTARLWSTSTSTEHFSFKNHQGPVNSTAITTDSKRFITGSESGQIRIYNDFSQTFQILFGHTASVNSLSLSSNNLKLLSGSSDNTVKLWNISQNQPNEITLTGHTSCVNLVKWRNDIEVISGSSDKTIKIWDVINKASIITLGCDSEIYSVDCFKEYVLAGCMNGKVCVWKGFSLVKQFDAHRGCVRSLKLNNVGRAFVTGSDDKTVKVWEIERTEPEYTFYGHTEAVNEVCLGPGQDLIVSASSDNNVRTWRLKRSLEDFTFDTNQGEITAISAVRNYRYIMIGSSDCSVSLWSTQEKRMRADLGRHESRISAVCISQSGLIGASGSTDGTVHLWDMRSLERFKTNHYRSPVTSLMITADDKFCVCSTQDCYVYAYNIESNSDDYRVQAHEKSVNSVKMTSDSALMITASSDRSVVIWDFLSQTKVCTLRGHSSKVNSLVLSVDEEYIFSGSNDALIKMWSITGQYELFTFIGHTDKVLSLCTTHNSKHLISGSLDRTVKVWNILEKREEFTLELHSEAILAVGVSSDSKYILSGSKDKTLKIWDTQENTDMVRFVGHNKAVNCVTSTYDGKYMISGSEDRTIKVWVIEAYAEKKTLEGHRQGVTCLTTTQDNNFIVSGSRDKYIIIWSLSSLTQQFTLKGHVACINTLCASSNSFYIYSASDDKSVRKWSIVDKVEEKVFFPHTGPVTALCLSSSDNHLTSGSTDLTIKVLNTQTNSLAAEFKGHKSAISSLVFTVNEKHIISSSIDGEIFIWNFVLKRVDHLIKLQDEISSISLSLDNRFIYSASRVSGVKVWNINENFEEFSINLHSDAINSIHVSPTGSTVFTASEDHSVIMWRTQKKIEPLKISAHKGGVHAIACSHSYYATGGADFNVRIWSNKSNIEEAELEGHTGIVLSLAFTGSGVYLASGSKDKTIKLWNVVKKSLEFTFEGHTDSVNTISIDKNDRFIVSGSNDKTVKLWNIIDRKEVNSLVGHTMYVYSVAFSSDSSQFASGSGDKLIKLWGFGGKTEKFTLAGHSLGVFTLQFALNPKLLVSGSSDKSIKVWNLEARRVEYSLNLHSQAVLSIFISSDDRYIISASADKTVKVSDFGRFTESFILNTFDDPIKCITGSLDGEYLFTGLGTDFMNVTQLSAVLKQKGFYSDSSYKYFLEDDTKSLSSHILTTFQDYYQFYNIFYCLKQEKYFNLSRKTSGMLLSKFSFTFTHVLCFLGQSAPLKSLISPDFVIRPDLFGHSPLYYCILKNDQECVDILLEYLINLSPTSNNSTYLTSYNAIKKDFHFIIKNSSSLLPDLLRSILYTQTTTYVATNVHLPITKFSDFQQISLNEFPVDRIDHSKYLDKLKPQKERHLRFLATALPLPDINGTALSLDMLDSILACKNLEIFSTPLIKYYIHSKLNSMKFLAYFLAFMLLANIAVSLSLITYGAENLYVFTAFAAVNAFLFFWELIQMRAGKFGYFVQILNIIDQTRFIITVVWVVLSLKGYQYVTLSWFMLAFNLIRGFTALRVFDSTRFYISLVSKLLKKIGGYLIVLAYCTFAFGIMNSVSTQQEFSFNSLWSDPFELNLSISSSNEEKNFDITYVGFLIASIINILILMNLLIAIIGEIYHTFMEKKEVIDVREKAELVQEIEQVIYSFKKGIPSFRYLQICDKFVSQPSETQPTINENDETIQKINSLEDKLRIITEQSENQYRVLKETVLSQKHPRPSITEKPLEPVFPSLNMNEYEEKLRSQSLIIARESFESVYRNSLPFAAIDRTEEIHEKLEQVSGTINQKIDSHLKEVNSLRKTIDRSSIKMKEDFEGIRAEVDSQKLLDLITKSTKSFEESLKAKIEQKFASIEGNIKNQLKKDISSAVSGSLEGFEKNIEEIVRDTVLEQMDHIRHDIDGKLNEIYDKINALS